MMLSDVSEFLLPRAPERDEGFRQEITRLAKRSLYILGAVEIGFPILAAPIGMFIAHEDRPPTPDDVQIRLWSIASFFALGLITIATAKTACAAKFPRLTASLSGLGAVAILVFFPLLSSPDAIFGQAAVETGLGLLFVQLVGLAVVPLRPMQMFAFGTSMWVLYLACAAWVSDWATAALAFEENHALHILPVATALCTGLSAVNYQRLAATYRSQQQTLEAQSRLFRAESAASMGWLTAALSHELNTPVGALQSAMTTLASVAKKRASAPQEEHQGLTEAETDLHRVALDATGRIQETVQRIQRLSNLDRPELLPVDLNGLLEDVSSTVRAEEQDPIALSTEFQTVPKILLHPQQIGSALSHVLRHAMRHARPDGRVVVTTRATDSAVEIAIETSTNQKSLGPAENVFVPSFEVRGPRVAAGNWELFASRQLIREHDGDIRAEEPAGGGLRFVVVLPV